MPILDPARRYDGFNDLSAGMDSGRTPESISPQSAALLVNVTARSGRVRTRASWVRRGLTGDTDELTALGEGFFQGAAPYYNPTTQKQALLVLSAGRLYDIDIRTYAVRDVTPTDGPGNTREQCYFCQAESFLVVQNGIDQPLIYDGDTARRVVVDTDEVPIGTLMAYGQGRLFVASPDRRELVAGDLVYGGSLTQVDIVSSSRTEVANGSTTTFTTATAHGLANSDRVNVIRHSSYKTELNAQWEISDVTATTFTVPIGVKRDGIGGLVQKFGEGREADLLRFTETQYLNEKGVFRLPAYMGRITGLTFFPAQDTATGQGDLMVFGEHGTAGFSISRPRETWLDGPLQRVALANIGASSPNSVVAVNSDVFFRSDDGLRTYRTAATDFANTYGQTPVSFEMARVMNFDSPNLLGKVSAGLFDNRLLFTVSPREVPELDGDPFAPVPTVFDALGVLDFNAVGAVGSKTHPAYDGIWTGLDILQLVASRFAGVGRAFLFAFTADRTTDLWEITTRSETGCDISDDLVEDVLTRTENPIQCALETRAFSFESPYSKKKLIRGDLWLADLLGTTDFRVFWRPDVHPHWFYWGSFTKTVAADSWVAGVLTLPGGVESWVPQALLPAIAPQVRMPTPPQTDDTVVTTRPAGLGFSFQLRLEWGGRAEVQKCILHTLDLVEAAQGSCPDEDTLTRTVRGQGSTVPTPAAAELLAHSSR